MRLILPLALLISFLATVHVFGQEPPPKPIKVTSTSQGLSFGTFSQGAAGGTVIVPASGVRTATGSVFLLNMNPVYSPALFEVEGNPGTIVSILIWPAAVINGGGGSMTLQIDTSYPVMPFVITTNPPLSTLLYIGGVLTVRSPGFNQPGTYSGTFNITLVQE